MDGSHKQHRVKEAKTHMVHKLHDSIYTKWKAGQIVLEARITTTPRTADSVSSSGSWVEWSVKSLLCIIMICSLFFLCSEKGYMKKNTKQVSLKDSVCAAARELKHCRWGFLRAGSEWRSAVRMSAKTASWGLTIMCQGQGGSRLGWQRRAAEMLSQEGLSCTVGSFETGQLRLLPAGVEGL